MGFEIFDRFFHARLKMEMLRYSDSPDEECTGTDRNITLMNFGYGYGTHLQTDKPRFQNLELLLSQIKIY